MFISDSMQVYQDVLAEVMRLAPESYVLYHLIPTGLTAQKLILDMLRDPDFRIIYQGNLGLQQDDLSREVANLGGLLHDVGYFADIEHGSLVKRGGYNKDHVEQGARYADWILRRMGYSAKDRVVQAVAMHNTLTPPFYTETATVFDADKIVLLKYPEKLLAYLMKYLDFDEAKAKRFLQQHADYSFQGLTSDVLRERHRQDLDRLKRVTG